MEYRKRRGVAPRRHTNDHRRLPGVLPVALAVALPACQSDESTDGSAFETHDSAGIQIVQNQRPAEDSRIPWRIGPEPAVSIGEVTGEDAYLLDEVNDATILTDGRIVIANTGTNELRVFDSGGVHMATWGGEGEGPAEFTSLWAVEPWPGDSVVAWNYGTWVVSIFDSARAFGRSFVLDLEAGALEPRAVLSDGSILGRTGQTSGEGYRRSRETYQLRHPETASPIAFGTHPGRESYLAFLKGMPVLGYLPFGRS